MKEKKARVEDALHATRAAVEEGIVPGGGVALIRAIKSLKELTTDNPDQDAGVNILRRALESPLRQIVSNAGDEASVVLEIKLLAVMVPMVITLLLVHTVIWLKWVF